MKFHFFHASLRQYIEAHSTSFSLLTKTQGSGFTPPTPDYIIAMTVIDSNGEIKFYDQSHPDLKVMAACLGMCGVVLDVTVKFNPDTSAVKVTQSKINYENLIPPRHVPINDSYNPLKVGNVGLQFLVVGCAHS